MTQKTDCPRSQTDFYPMTHRLAVHTTPTPSSTLCCLAGSFEQTRQPRIWISCLRDCRQVPNDKILIRRTRRGLAWQLDRTMTLSSASGCSNVKGNKFQPRQQPPGFYVPHCCRPSGQNFNTKMKVLPGLMSLIQYSNAWSKNKIVPLCGSR